MGSSTDCHARPHAPSLLHARLVEPRAGEARKRCGRERPASAARARARAIRRDAVALPLWLSPRPPDSSTPSRIADLAAGSSAGGPVRRAGSGGERHLALGRPAGRLNGVEGFGGEAVADPEVGVDVA